MAESVAGLVLALVLVALFAVTKRGREYRHRGARTVSCRITADGAERDLADGRRESVRFAALVQIEVVRTPVSTADGAQAFALLAESLGEAPTGCLFPLGVGYDEVLLDRLVRLPGFDTRAWTEALAKAPPSRVIVWDEPPVDAR